MSDATEASGQAHESGSTGALELTAHVVGYTENWVLEPASPRRDWMDDTAGFAYRCLPLSIANQCGWVVRAPCGASAIWDGGPRLDNAEVKVDDERHVNQITSHFGWGIITFSLPWLFRTPPGYGMIVRGPTNRWFENIHALDGIVETDWATSTFTMNWKIVEPDRRVRFEKGDPICHIIPYPMEMIERFQPLTMRLESNAPLEDEYRAWADSRRAFNANTERKASDWQKDYLKGETVKGQKAREHRSRLKIRPFHDLS